MRYFWTTTETAVLREHYAQGGLDACQALLPTRTRSSIYQQAAKLGLRAPGEPKVRARFETTPEIDAAIVLAHQKALRRGDITALAAKLQRPRWWVSRRARDLKLKTPRFSGLPWTAPELLLLEDTAHLSDPAASRRFKAAGFDRSPTAIHVQRTRNRISRTLARQDAGMLNATQVADWTGACRKAVLRWISEGELTAKRRGTPRTDGHDEWVVRMRDLRQFILTHPLRIDLGRIPMSTRPWFIELLAGAS